MLCSQMSNLSLVDFPHALTSAAPSRARAPVERLRRAATAGLCKLPMSAGPAWLCAVLEEVSKGYAKIPRCKLVDGLVARYHVLFRRRAILLLAVLPHQIFFSDVCQRLHGCDLLSLVVRNVNTALLQYHGIGSPQPQFNCSLFNGRRRSHGCRHFLFLHGSILIGTGQNRDHFRRHTGLRQQILRSLAHSCKINAPKSWMPTIVCVFYEPHDHASSNEGLDVSN